MFETSKDSFGTIEDKGNYRDGIKNKAAEKNFSGVPELLVSK